MTNISEKRFETGDAIEIENQIMGTVERIDLRSTKIVGFDEVPRYVPNADLSNAIVKNYSVLKRRRVLVKVPLVLSSTQDQIEAVRDGLKAYHRTSGDFDLTDAAPKYIYVSGLGPSSIDIMIYAWTTGPAYELLLQVTERLSLAILRITREAGTKLAYPTQTLHLTTQDFSKPIPLKFVKFQRVKNITLFIEDNQGGEVSCLGGLQFFGRPVASTNMADFKKQKE